MIDSAALGEAATCPTPHERLRDALGANAASVRYVGGHWLVNVFHNNGLEVSGPQDTIENAVAFVKGELGDDD